MNELVTSLDLRLVKSTVFRCANCKTWYARIPAWDDLDKGDACEKCGCTSFTSAEGRPFGPKHHLWAIILDEWECVRHNKSMFDAYRGTFALAAQPGGATEAG